MYRIAYSIHNTQAQNICCLLISVVENSERNHEATAACKNENAKPRKLCFPIHSPPPRNNETQ